MRLSCIYICSSYTLGLFCTVLPSTSAASQELNHPDALKCWRIQNTFPRLEQRKTQLNLDALSCSLSLPYPHYSSPPLIFLLQYSSSQTTPSPASACSWSSRRQASLNIRPVSIIKSMSYAVGGVARSKQSQSSQKLQRVVIRTSSQAYPATSLHRVDAHAAFPRPSAPCWPG
jgi:hypothetical protein